VLLFDGVEPGWCTAADEGQERSQVTDHGGWA